jgi:hypothetical protein
MCKERIAPRAEVSAHAQKEDFHCARRRCFCACARDDISLRKEEMFQCTCKERIAPRGDVSANAQREDISLRHEEMLQLKHKVMIFHCAKRRCFSACKKRGYFIAPR